MTFARQRLTTDHSLTLSIAHRAAAHDKRATSGLSHNDDLDAETDGEAREAVEFSDVALVSARSGLEGTTAAPSHNLLNLSARSRLCCYCD